MSSHFQQAENKKGLACFPPVALIYLLFALFLAGCAGKRPEPAPEMPPVVIFAGDSIMEGLGPELEKSLRASLQSGQYHGKDLSNGAAKSEKRHVSGKKRPDKAGADQQEAVTKPSKQARHGRYDPLFVQAGRSSSGLCRPDFYDWPAKMRELVANARSGWVIICIGTNDDQSVAGADGKKRAFATGAWPQAYSHRVGEIIEIIANAGARQIWLSPPVMREPLGGRVMKIKEVIARTCAEKRVPYLDIWQNLADAGGGFLRYRELADGTKIAIRTRDGVHLTRAGNQELARQLVPYLTRTMQLK